MPRTRGEPPRGGADRTASDIGLFRNVSLREWLFAIEICSNVIDID
jgi:hypothetical protein